MSRDAYNALVAKHGKSLPGRNDDTTDTSRGYVGWGPGEDAMCDNGRTVEHADWEATLAAIQYPLRELHDFYFEVDTPSVRCDCCAGSGVSKEYNELADGFYRHGGGRWAGWGDGKLFQNEIDELIARRRLGRDAMIGSVTPDNLHKFLSRMGHDAINRWILIPIRAKNLGMDCTECFDCAGTGLTPTDSTKIMLHLWTFNPESGKSRTDTALDVKLEEVEQIREHLNEFGWEGVRRRFGWASGDNMYSEIRYDSNFKRDIERPFKKAGERIWWTDSVVFDSFAAFKEQHIGGDTDLNLVLDYRIITDDEHLQDNHFARSELPSGPFRFAVWLTHPRKGASRTILVDNCHEEDGEDIKNYLKASYEVHGRHFAWAAGRPFGNEKVEEADETPDEPYDAVKFFSGR